MVSKKVPAVVPERFVLYEKRKYICDYLPATMSITSVLTPVIENPPS